MAAISLGVALFLTVSGAFGLGGASPARRFTYWMLTLLAGSAVSIAGQGWMERRPASRLWPDVVLLALTLSVLMTPMVFLMTRAFFGGGWRWIDFLGFFPPVLAVSAMMTVLNVLTLRARRAGGDPASPTAVPEPQRSEPSAFMRRLPPKLRGAELYAVEAEDHYLRVHTDRGSDLLLMRLADALDELGPIEGARTHRSWWVARAAVADARRGDGRATLVLKDGSEAPVSRSYAPALREAGWF